MKMIVLAGVSASLLLASAALAQSTRLDMIEFAGGPPQTAQLSGFEAIVYGDDDAPKFRGPQDFILKYAANAPGRVYAWDAVRQKVRITPKGKDGVWLACEELQPMSIACASSFRVSAEGDLVIDNVSRASGPNRSAASSDEGTVRNLPVCPSDPRCPHF